MDCITQDVIDASELMKDIHVESVQCVNNFLKHPELIQWLRKNMSKYL